MIIEQSQQSPTMLSYHSQFIGPQSSSATCGFQFHLLPVPPPMAICPRASALRVPMIIYRSCYNYKTHNCLIAGILCQSLIMLRPGQLLQRATDNLRTTWATTLVIIKAFPSLLHSLRPSFLSVHTACLNNTNILINFRSRVADGTWHGSKRARSGSRVVHQTGQVNSGPVLQFIKLRARMGCLLHCFSTQREKYTLLYKGKC